MMAACIGLVSVIYAMGGQAGGTAFLAVMALSVVPVSEIRPTALMLNGVAAGYGTWRMHRAGLIDRDLLCNLGPPSLPAALLGGLIELGGRTYLVLAGAALLIAAAFILWRVGGEATDDIRVRWGLASAVGAGTGFLSGLTGVGGGVFLAPVLLGLGWASPRRVAGLSPPFILANSAIALCGVIQVGQYPAPDTPLYGMMALLGAVAGTAIGLRWMSQAATRYLIAAILALAGARLLPG